MKLVDSNDPILKAKAEPWDFHIDAHADDLEDELIDTMIANKGVGLAAPQVGINKRVFVIQLANGRRMAMFNPVVLEASKQTETDEEGCLSFPGMFLPVKRAKEVTSEFLDKNGQKCTMTLKGREARCFLHELDHLDGVCFVEKPDMLHMALMLKKQQQRKRYK